MKFYTWLFTIRTKGPLDRACADEVVSYLKKKCRFGYVVLEVSPELHLHASVCFKSPIEKKTFEETVWSKLERTHPDSIKRVALKSTVQYNHHWIDEYLQKDNERIVLWHKYEHVEYANYFPTAEEQAELVRSAEARAPLPTEAKDPRFARLEQGWTEYSSSVTYIDAVKYLEYSMYQERSMPVITDQRRLHQTAWCLYKYRSRDLNPSVEAVRFGHLMDGTISHPGGI